MRIPKGKKSERKRLERIAEDFGLRCLCCTMQRKAVPRDSWDDVQISYTRGQPWQRVVKSQWQKR